MAQSKYTNPIAHGMDTLLAAFGETVALRRKTSEVAGNKRWYTDATAYEDVNILAMPDSADTGVSSVIDGQNLDEGFMSFSFRGQGIPQPRADVDYIVWQGKPRLITEVQAELPFGGVPLMYDCVVRL